MSTPVASAAKSGPTTHLGAQVLTSVSGNPQDQFNQLWSQTLSEYTKKTRIDLSKHPLSDVLNDLGSPEAICEAFEAKMKRFRASDSRWGKIRNGYVKPIVDALLLVNDTLGETAGNFSVVPGGKVLFVAFGALLLATKGVSERYDALTTLLGEIKFFFESARLRATNPSSWGRLSRSIASLMLTHVLDVFALATQFFTTTNRSCARLFHFGQSLTNKKDMQEALRRLRVLGDLESRAILSETRVDAAGCRNVAEQLRQDLGSMKLERDTLSLRIVERSVGDFVSRLTAIANELRETMLSSEEKAEARDLLGRLDRVDFADISSQRRGGCLPGTRVTVLETLFSWSNEINAQHIYWLNGMAGTGKSSIARSFAQRLKDNGALGGSYFCSRESRAELADAQRIMPTLAAVLAEFDVQYKVALLSVLQSYSSEARPSAWALKLQIERLFVQPFTCFMRQVTRSPIPILVIDALDEANDDTVADLLDTLVSVTERVPIKFFLTSRPERHIRWRLDSLQYDAFLRLQDIEVTVVTADIRLYINHRFQAILDRYEGRVTFPQGWPTERDREGLITLSGLLFIYAFTTTEYIGDRSPVQRLREVIDVGHRQKLGKNPLGDLDRIYTFILDTATSRLSPQDLHLTRRILVAILASRELLSLRTMARLLGLEAQDIKDALDELHAVINVPDDIDNGSLSTLHASFGDFLTDAERAPNGMHMSLIDGHRELAVGCIDVLSDDLHFNMSCAQTSYLSNEDQNIVIDLAHDTRYACIHWIEHAKEVGEPPAVLLTKVKRFLLTNLFFWLEGCSLLGVKSSHIQGLVQALQEWELPEDSSFPKVILQEVSDLLKLVGECVDRSAPHVYLSMIPFMKPFPRLLEAYGDMFSQLASPYFQWLDETLKDGGFRLVACSLDGTYVSGVTGFCTVYIWNGNKGDIHLRYNGSGHGDQVWLMTMAFTSDAMCLLTASEICDVSIWDVASGECVRQLNGNGCHSCAITFSLDLKYFGAVQSADRYPGWHIAVWKLPLSYDEDMQLMPTLHLPAQHAAKSVNSEEMQPSVIEFSPNGTHVIIGTNQSDIFVWKLGANEPCLWLSSHVLGFDKNVPIEGIAFISESEIVFIAFALYLNGSNGVYHLRLNDTFTESLSELPLRLYFQQDRRFLPTAIVVSKEEVIVTSSADALCLWDVCTGKFIGSNLQGHITCTEFLFVSSNRTFIISGSSSGHVNNQVRKYNINSSSIIVWDIDPGSDRCRAAMNNHFNHFYLPWLDSGWLRGPNQELLLYIPKEYHPYVQHPPIIHRFGAGRLTIDWTNAVHGEDWTKCYVGPK